METPKIEYVLKYGWIRVRVVHHPNDPMTIVCWRVEQDSPEGGDDDAAMPGAYVVFDGRLFHQGRIQIDNDEYLAREEWIAATIPSLPWDTLTADELAAYGHKS